MATKQTPAKAAPQKASMAPAARKPPTAPQAAPQKVSRTQTSGAKVPPAKVSASKAQVAAPAKAAPVATVTLKQLAAEIAEQQQIEKRDADKILTGLVGILVQHLTNGDRLRIGGLGILEVKDKPERAGRNPATGETITIKASKKIAFRPAKELKEAI
jgi:DNA-binding protein HU-beta